MLVQFSVGNYTVFRDEACLMLFASNYDKTTLEEENVFEVPGFGLRLLKSAVVYGANASGKTKLIEAARFMRTFVLSSSKESQQGERIGVEPFRLNAATAGQPSRFEVVFIEQEALFRYGFEVTAQAVVREWLYHRPHTKEVEIFTRKGQTFETHPRQFRKGDLLAKEGLVRPNALMLSVAAQFNVPIATTAVEWFRKFRQLSGLRAEEYMGFSMAKAEGMKAKMLALLREADLGIEDFRVEQHDADSLPDQMPEALKTFIREQIAKGDTVFAGVRTVHTIYDEAGRATGREVFDLDWQESAGTRKFFSLLGPVLHTLEHGEVLFVDELDSRLHPHLVQRLVALFHSKTTNPGNAQFVFNTHSPYLLGAGLFRRDQVWFVEKDRAGAASLYSLASFKTDEGGRKTDNFEANYLQGRYGAVPVMGDFEAALQPETTPAP